MPTWTIAKSQYNIARTLGNIFAVVHPSRRAFYILGLFMNGKKGFILFGDIAEPINNLSDEDAGKLIKAIFAYQNGGVTTDLPVAASVAFNFIKLQMDRSNEHYEKVCERNRKNIQDYWNKVKDTTVYDRIDSNTNVNDGYPLNPGPNPNPGPKPKKEEKKDIRHKHGDKVELTDKEYQTHIEKRGKDTVDTMIDDMNDWCVSHGKSFADYNRALHTWFKKDENEAKQKLAADIDMWDNPK